MYLDKLIKQKMQFPQNTKHYTNQFTEDCFIPITEENSKCVFLSSAYTIFESKTCPWADQSNDNPDACDHRVCALHCIVQEACSGYTASTGYVMFGSTTSPHICPEHCCTFVSFGLNEQKLCSLNACAAQTIFAITSKLCKGFARLSHSAFILLDVTQPQLLNEHKDYIHMTRYFQKEILPKYEAQAKFGILIWTGFLRKKLQNQHA